MTKVRFRIALLALVLALLLGAVAYGATFTAAKGNNAEAQATGAPNTSVFDLALGLRENDTDVVDEANSAFAHSTCDGCRSVALAYQVVIVQGTPSQVTPANVAVALNENCTGCSSLALAYQFVVGKGEPARITKSGRRQLATVGDDLLRLERSYTQYTDAEIQARADADAAKVGAILDTELVPVDAGGPKPDVQENRKLDRGV
jgi:hypothetical protein